MKTSEIETEQEVKLVTLRNLVGHTVSSAYRLDSVIGEGGMGIVFEAVQLKLDRRIALKVLKLDGPNAQEAFSRFERELAILANLSHPNIVRVLDSGHDSNLDLYYIAMDLVGGKPLAELISGYRYQPALALELIYQLCGALAQPHSEGVIHRDLKPDNVIVEVIADETMQVRLVDFGIARAFSADQRLTATGVVVGTPHYMAPELVREKELDLRTDIYALGVMLHELLTGSLPFDGSNFMQIGFKHVQAQVPKLSSKVRELQDPALEKLVATMMAKEKADRFSTVSEVRRAIEEIVDEQSLPRVRLDPSLAIEDALAPWRVAVDGSRAPTDSARWLPPHTPQGSFEDPLEPGVAGAHKALTTTAVESVAPASKLPLLVAIIAVVVAAVAVVVALSVSVPGDRSSPGQTPPVEASGEDETAESTEPPDTPTEPTDTPTEPTEPTEPTAPSNADDVVAEEPSEPSDDTNAAGERRVDDQTPKPASTNGVDKPSKTSEKGAGTSKDEPDFEEAMDWIQSND